MFYGKLMHQLLGEQAGRGNCDYEPPRLQDFDAGGTHPEAKAQRHVFSETGKIYTYFHVHAEQHGFENKKRRNKQKRKENLHFQSATVVVARTSARSTHGEDRSEVRRFSRENRRSDRKRTWKIVTFHKKTGNHIHARANSKLSTGNVLTFDREENRFTLSTWA